MGPTDKGASAEQAQREQAEQTGQVGPDERIKEVSVSYVRRLRLEEKTCPQCGKVFFGVKKRRYCDRPCQAKADYARHAEQYRQARMDSYRRRKAATQKSIDSDGLSDDSPGDLPDDPE
jgi:hypothetical protein